MRLALIGPVYPYRGGIAHYTTMLYRALRDRKHEVLMVSFKRQYPQWLFPGKSDKDPSEDHLEIKEARYWIDSLNPFTWVSTFWRILRYQPDAMVLQWWTTFWAPVWFVLGMLNSLFLGGGLVIICHNVLPHEVRPHDHWLARLSLTWGTHFIVHSMEEKNKLLSLLPEAQVITKPLPEFEMFAGKRITKKDARKQLGLPSGLPTLLFFGIVREYKGLGDLLRVLPEVRARLSKVTLVVAGEFWEDKSFYMEMIEQLNIGDSVYIDDRYIPNEDVPLYFSAADVLIAPYRRVTGSAVVQMAKGFGLPVIATSTGGLMETVIDGETGFVFPPEDSEALTRAITRYFQEEHMASMEQKIATTKGFSWNNLVHLLTQIVVENDPGLKN